MVPLAFLSKISATTTGRERALLALRQLAELDVSASVAVEALENGLPLVDVGKQVGELLRVYRARPVAVEHVCMEERIRTVQMEGLM